MNPSPNTHLDRRALGLLSESEEANLQAEALSNPDLRRALDADDVVERALAGDRAAQMPPLREPDPALLEQLLSTGSSVSVPAAASNALQTILRFTVGFGAVAVGVIGVRAIITTEPVLQEKSAGKESNGVRMIDPALLNTMGVEFARAFSTVSVASTRSVATLQLDSNRERRSAGRGAMGGGEVGKQGASVSVSASTKQQRGVEGGQERTTKYDTKAE